MHRPHSPSRGRPRPAYPAAADPAWEGERALDALCLTQLAGAAAGAPEDGAVAVVHADCADAAACMMGEKDPWVSTVFFAVLQCSAHSLGCLASARHAGALTARSREARWPG